MNICVTRFDNKTFKENLDFRNNNNIKCIYGSPVKITDLIFPNDDVIVLEMNNTTNSLEGIGIIKNKLFLQEKKRYKIYSDNNYNRFIYISNKRIDKSNFSENEKEVIKYLENLLFKSYYHCKRGQGIQQIPKRIENNEYNLNFKKFLINMYNSRFILIKNIKLLE